MTAPQIPAPERDLANTDPQVPPATEDTSPVTRAIFGTLAVGMGAAIIIVAVLSAAFQISPLPTEVFDGENMLAFLFASLCGACLIGCGTFIFRRSLVMTAIFLIVAVICGALTTAIT